MIDPLAALRCLVEHDVRFVLIGGQAGLALGSPILADDVGVCYDRSRDNLERLAEALRAMNARLRGVDEDVPCLLDATTLRDGDSFTFTTDFGPVDVVATPTGTRGYDDLRAGASRLDVGGFEVDVVAVDDLIRMERATGGAKDAYAVEILVALRDELRDR